MKKILFCILFLGLTACGAPKEETLLLKCQKLRNYEFYTGVNIIGVYGIDSVSSRIEMVENYAPKWDDVDNKTLKEQLQVQKSELEKVYTDISFKIDEYRRDITSDFVLPMTDKNKNVMKTDDNYASSFEGNDFSVDKYRSLLEENGFVCES